ncbi:MAG: tetratricopeptide repeat protein [Bacteroidia bacterium]
MKSFWRSLVLFCLPLIPFAQNRQIDSFLNIIRTSQVDTTLIEAFNELNWENYNIGKFDTSIYYVNKALEIENKILEGETKNEQVIKYAQRAKGISLMYLGGSYQAIGNFSEALKINHSALAFFKGLNDREGMANIYFGLGSTYRAMGNFSESLKNHFQALKIREQLGDKKAIAASYNNIGSVYKSLHEYDKALEFYRRSLRLKESVGDLKGMGNSYNNIANIYATQKKFNDALDNHRKALALRQKVNDMHGVAVSYENFGAVYTETNNYPEASKYLFMALDLYTEQNDKSGECTVYLALCELMYQQKKLHDAGSYGKEGLALAKEIEELEAVRNGYEVLSKVYEADGNPQKSLEYYKNYILMRDSLLNEDNTKKNVQLQMQYEFDKKEAATRLEQEKRDAIAGEESRKQKIIITAVSVGLLLLGILAIVILRNLRINQKKNRIISLQKEAVERQKEIVEEKQKEILDSIYYARRIQRALLPQERYIARNLKSLDQ